MKQPVINKLLTPYNFTDKNSDARIKYIVIHYVGALGGAKANCQYYAGQYIGASAHFFVGFEGEIWQAVETEDIAWHCGASSYKHAECRNSNSIGIELCVRKRNTASMGATDKDWYFEDATVEAAVALTRYLMEKYNVPASHVIRHYDVTGKICPNPYVYNTTAHTWDEFKKKISGAAVTAGGMVQNGNTEKAIWDYLAGKGLNACAVAGLMGNLYAESGLNSCNLQNSYNKKLNISDADYTAVVDAGAYPDFVTDKAGYGLVQWTYWSRKKALLDYAKAAGTSIGDLNMQLAFMWQELQGYKAVMTVLNSAASVREASDIVLHKYEQPGDQSVAVEEKRAASGQTFFDRFTGSSVSPFPIVPFLVRVVIPDLNIRTSPGSADNSNLSGKYTGIGTFTIVEISGSWGLLKSYRKKRNGWIYLGNPDYCEICS